MHYAIGMAWIAAVCALAVSLVAGPPQQLPVPPVAQTTPIPQGDVYRCDPDGLITCTYQQTETVTGSRSLQDMRIIGKYIELISERNRRYYLTWQEKAPSAAYELVRHVKAFPYLPYADTYAISGLVIALDQAENRITVSYPKKVPPTQTTPVAKQDLVSYSTKLSDFIKTLEQEIVKLKKYEKAPAASR